jgi:hypothetical protein
MVPLVPRTSAVVIFAYPLSFTCLSRSLYLPRRRQQFSGFRQSLRPMSTINYPQTRREELVENLHGVKIADPYRWLEDPKSEETKVVSY